jgi:hypothetical protein
MCGRHAINHVFNKQKVLDKELKEICVALEIDAGVPIEQAGKTHIHCDETGNFSSLVLTTYFKQNNINYKHYVYDNTTRNIILQGDNVSHSFDILKNIIDTHPVNIKGFIVGNGNHWFAVRRRTTRNAWILVDSLDSYGTQKDYLFNSQNQLTNLFKNIKRNMEQNGELFIIYNEFGGL